MKIVVVNTYENYGGAARAANRLFKGLCDLSPEVSATMFVNHRQTNDARVTSLQTTSEAVVARVQARQNEITAEQAPYPMLHQPDRAIFNGDRAALGAVLVDQLPAADVVNLHWTSTFLDWEMFFASLSPNIPVVWTLHDMNAFTGGCHYANGCEGFVSGCGRCPLLQSADADDLSHRILRRKQAILANWPGTLHVVTPSRWLGEEARRSALFRNRPVHVIPYGLETDLFQPQDRTVARSVLKLPQDKKIILFTAHVLTDSRKGLAYLDEALVRLGPQEDVFLLMVGMGAPEPRAPVHRVRANLVNDDRTMSMIYAAADVVAVPSQEDNLPNTVLEGMASGRAVIGFAIGGIPDMVIPGETGFLAKLGDAASLAEAFRAGLSDIAALRAMGVQARKRIEARHTLAIQARSYADLFAELTRRPAVTA